MAMYRAVSDAKRQLDGPFWDAAKKRCALPANKQWASFIKYASRGANRQIADEAELQKLYETFMRPMSASSPAARSASSPTRRPLNTHTAANSSPAETAKRNTAARAAAHATRPPLRPPKALKKVKVHKRQATGNQPTGSLHNGSRQPTVAAGHGSGSLQPAAKRMPTRRSPRSQKVYENPPSPRPEKTLAASSHKPAAHNRKMCEDCGLKWPNFGLLVERKEWWCAGCL